MRPVVTLNDYLKSGVEILFQNFSGNNSVLCKLELDNSESVCPVVCNTWHFQQRQQERPYAFFTG
jgi:hypothetical protein